MKLQEGFIWSYDQLQGYETEGAYSGVTQKTTVPKIGGDKRALTKLILANITTKTLAYSEVFGFFRTTCHKKK